MKTKLLFFIMLVAILTGCSRKVYLPIETVRTDTLKVETHDTLKVNQRPMTVSVTLPQTHLERTTRDTTSTLQNGLYRSTAAIRNGLLYHSMETMPGATVIGQVTVADTTRTTGTKQLEKSSTAQKKTVTVEVEKKLTMAQQVALWTGYAVWTAVLMTLVGFGGYRLIKQGRQWKWL
jgi:hypothetical protein